MKIRINNYTDFSLNYRTSEDKFKMTDEEIVKLLDSYIGKRATFECSNFYGGSDVVKIWVEGYERVEKMNPYIDYIITLRCSQHIPDRYYPSLLQVGQQFGLVGPISYELLH